MRMLKHYLFAGMLFPAVLFSQQVTTIVNDPSTRFRDDLLFDAAGNLYCADYGGNAVFKRTPDGTVTTFASGFNTPNGLAFDSQQNLFVADNVGNRIYKLDYSGQFLDTFAITGPSGLIRMPDSDTLLFTQYPGNSLNKLAPDGTVVPLYTGAPVNGAVGLTWSPEGRLYMANFTDSKVFEVVFGATVTLDSLAALPDPASGNSWLGFIEYAQGFIWATAFSTHKIYKIDPGDGEVTYVAGSTSGSTDGDVAVARFSNPNGIAASVTGDTLYVSDYGTGRLRMLTEIPLEIDEGAASFPVVVYPNPVTESFRLTFPEAVAPDYMELIDVSGKQFRVWHILQQGLEYSAKGMPAGVYLLRLVVGDEVVEKRLLVE